MKKTTSNLKFIILFFSLFFYQLTKGQNLNKLFYCNSTNDISNLWVLGTTGFVGHTIKEDKNYLYLFSKEGIVLDTLEVGDNQIHFLQSLIVINDSIIQFNTMNKNAKYGIKNGRWLKVFEYNRAEYEQTEIATCGHHYTFNNITIGVSCGTIGKKKQHYLAYFLSGGVPYTIYDFKVENKNKTYLGSGLLDADIMFNKKDNLLYMPIEGAGKLVLFNINSLTSRIIEFAILDSRNESYRPFYDYHTDRLYVVNYKKNENNKLFILDEDEQLVFIKEIEVNPVSIVGDYMHIIQQDGNKNNCHYLIPINTTNESIQLLEGVEIKTNNNE